MPAIIGLDQAVLLAWGLFVLSTISPGPALMATIAAATGEGRRAGLLVGLGITCGSLTWGLAAASGLTAVLLAWPSLLPMLQFFAGLWLLRLALRAARAALRAAPLPETHARRGWPVLRGYLIHLVNPNAMLGWAAIVMVGLGPQAPGGRMAVILAGAGAMALVFYSACALAFSTPAVLRAYLRTRRPVEATLAALFAIASLQMLRAAAASLG